MHSPGRFLKSSLPTTIRRVSPPFNFVGYRAMTDSSLESSKAASPCNERPNSPDPAESLENSLLSSLERFRLTEKKKDLELILDVESLAFPLTSKKTQPSEKAAPRSSEHDLNVDIEIGDNIAVDCEMVVTDQGSTLARVAVVDERGRIIYHAFVNPKRRVKNWCTKYSGVSLRVLQRAHKKGELVTFERAQYDLQGIFNGRTVIGHAVHNDFKAMKLKHPSHRTIDTQKLPLWKGSKNGLKSLMAQYYGIEIQTSKAGHSPIDDARASMLLFRTFQKEFLQAKSPKNAAGITELDKVARKGKRPHSSSAGLATSSGQALILSSRDIFQRSTERFGKESATKPPTFDQCYRGRS